jgi:dTDP-D-glucose 4,6-dehydratase
MDMRSNTSGPIILGRPFFRTTCDVIDSKEGNIKFQLIPTQEVYGALSKEEYKCSKAQVFS